MIVLWDPVLGVGTACDRGLRRRSIRVSMARGRVAVPLVLRAAQADLFQRACEIAFVPALRVGKNVFTAWSLS
jgi:hypothetical protein